MNQKQFFIGAISYDAAEFKNENYLEGFVLFHEDVLKLPVDGFDNPQIIGTQLVVTGAQVNGSDGRLDILVAYDADTYGIVELKNPIADLSRNKNGLTVVDQLTQYLEHTPKDKGVIDVIRKYRNGDDEEEGVKEDAELPQWVDNLTWVGVILAPDMDLDIVEEMMKNRKPVSCVHLTNGQDIPVYGLTLNYFKAKEVSDYIVHTSVAFLPKTTVKTKKKYRFNGIRYPSVAAIMEVTARDYVNQSTKKGFNPLSDVAADFGLSRVFYAQPTPSDLKRYVTTPVTINGQDYYIYKNYTHDAFKSVVDNSKGLKKNGRLSDVITLV